MLAFSVLERLPVETNSDENVLTQNKGISWSWLPPGRCQWNSAEERQATDHLEQTLRATDHSTAEPSE